MKKKFLLGFLVMAMITLLSGMIQANNVVAETSTDVVMINSPPAVLPAIDFCVNITFPASIWYCTLNPGYRDQCSANVTDKAVINADILSMYHIYLTKLNKRYYTNRFETNYTKVNYRMPRDGLRQSWQA